MNSLSNNLFFKSTTDSVLTGVCGGVAKRFNIDSTLVRIGFVVGTFMLGLSTLLYFVFAVCLPKDNEMAEASNSKVLGVCARLAKKMNWDVAIVRSSFLSSLILSLIPSFGTTLIIYFVMHFVLPEQESKNNNIVDVKAKDIK